MSPKTIIIISLISASLVLIGWLITALPSDDRAYAQANLPATDWPQLGRNPQRWNYHPDSLVNPPYPVKWAKALTDYGIAHRLYASAQVIMANVNNLQTVFIGAKSGTIFAFNANTGVLLWQYATDGAILHTLGYENGRVFAATMQGSVYAINATNGSLSWRYNTQRPYGFVGAVLLAENHVFAVDEGGYLYGLTQTTGDPIWDPYIAQAPVISSPTYDNGQVFFGSEDLKVHAVNAVSGVRTWLSPQVEGQSFIDAYPVILNGKVLVVTMTGLEPEEGLTTPNPPIKSLQALDENTGNLLPAPPHYLVNSMNGPHTPPAVTADGLLVTSWVYGQAWGGSSFALVNPQTNTMVESLNISQDTGGAGAPDEQLASSVFGNTLVIVHHAGLSWGNPNTQSGSYDRPTRTWTNWSSDHVMGIYGSDNMQNGGATAMSGTNTLLCHQSFDTIRCFGR